METFKTRLKEEQAPKPDPKATVENSITDEINGLLAEKKVLDGKISTLLAKREKERLNKSSIEDLYIFKRRGDKFTEVGKITEIKATNEKVIAIGEIDKEYPGEEMDCETHKNLHDLNKRLSIIISAISLL